MQKTLFVTSLGGRFPNLLITLTLLSGAFRAGAQVPPRPAAAHAHSPVANNPQAQDSGQTTNAPKKTLLEVHHLPDFCFSVNQSSLKLESSVLSNRPCPNGQVKFHTQNAADVAKALSGASDFDVQAVGTDAIAISQIYSRDPAPAPNSTKLNSLRDTSDSLAKPQLQFAVLVEVSSGSASQSAQQLNAIGVPGVTVATVGNDHLVLQADASADFRIIDFLKKRLADLQWDLPYSVPPTQRLFELTASDVVKSLSPSSTGSAKSDPSAGSSKSDSSSISADDSGGGGKASSAAVSPAVSVTVNATSAQESANPSSKGTSSEPSDINPSASADKSSPLPGSGKSSVSSKIASSASSSKISDTPKPLTMQAVTDTLVFSNADGSDSGVAERTRLITMLDLPRPEVLINMWAFQVSSPSSDVVARRSEAVREAVVHHNELLQHAIENGWDYLSKASRAKTKQNAQAKSFFEPTFYNYVTKTFYIDPALREVLSGAAKPEFKPDPSAGQRDAWGQCTRDAYCLGFAHAFEPLRPTFTNILLTIAASNNPQDVARNTIANMTGLTGCDPGATQAAPGCDLSPVEPGGQIKEASAARDQNQDFAHSPKEFIKCLRHSRGLLEANTYQAIDASSNQQPRHTIQDCEVRDRLVLAQQSIEEKPQSLQLNCFAEQAQSSFAEGAGDHQATRVGLLRAAIADFLFNYKMAQQYPHDFIPYDLSQSAQELNSEFNPLILSFNRDVAAFTENLQTELQCRESVGDNGRWIGDERGTFVNDALLTVRTISGVESLVDTVSQSFFDGTKPPNLTDLVSSVATAEKNIPDVLKANLTSHEAAVLIGALNSVQPAQAKIGRQFTLDITPHSLAGASSAELEVKLTNQESAAPTLFKGDKSSEDNLSRVARHNTSTKVRVESLKLFEVSAFSAVLQRPRSRFPIIPPFFEIPYFGSLVGIPLSGAKEYHRSTAVVSAVIVPTAADLAYGIDFSADRVCEQSNSPFGMPDANGNYTRCHRAKAFSELGGLPFRNYHKALVQCLASGNITSHIGTLLFSADAGSSRCESLRFSDVPPSY
jgi:hypothetical protein